MVHLIQVGAGSGGMPVLDLLCRDERVTRVTLIEPDVYKPHNVVRHVFPASAVGRLKADLARDWLLERRPGLDVRVLPVDLLDPAAATPIEEAAASADVGVCAADNEQAKYHWDALLRRHGKPWTLGEVLSGGIGGFVHRFTPGGACYGCVASHLKRNVEVEKPKAPDYSQPGGPAPEVTVPASRASIAVIAGLHAQVTLQMLQRSAVGGRRSADEPEGSASPSPDFTSLLFTLERVPDVFDEAFRTYRFRIGRSDACLVCRPTAPTQATGGDLDAALDQALGRLGGGDA